MSTVRRTAGWLNLPLGVLLALLQRTPALRVVGAARDYVIASPAGQLLRAAFTLASLGAIHSKAGATTFVGPVGTVTGTVGRAIQPVAFTYVGTPSSPARFEVSGTLPPGLGFIPAAAGSVISSGTPAITGTPTQAGTYIIFVQGFNAEGLTNNIQQQIVFEIEGAVQAVAPTITAHPQSRTANAGTAVSLTVQATGSPAPTYQWRRNGNLIGGATGATLTLPSVQASDAGEYSVIVANSAGTVTSNAAVLTVNTGGSGPIPQITAQPASQTIAVDSTVVFSVGATGATSFQWRRNGVDLPNATSATLVLSGATAANAGVYTVIVANGAGSVASTGATLTVSPAVDLGRLTNLAILTDIAADELFTLGTVVGRPNAGAKPLLVRAAGPALSQLQVQNPLPDPKLEVFANGRRIAINEDWGGAASMEAIFESVGAFPYAAANSRDAAAFDPAAPAGSYTIDVQGTPGTSGAVIAEIYDASNATVDATTPRLVNVSVLKHVPADSLLIAGFTIGGGSGAAKTVLIRAIGPTLAGDPFFVGGAMLDPKLEVYRGDTLIASNDNWGGDPQLVAAAARVAAFPIADPASRDAILIITLPPGSGYTAQVSGIGGGGTVIAEVYEIP